jgi:hypothetical protein
MEKNTLIFTFKVAFICGAKEYTCLKELVNQNFQKINHVQLLASRVMTSLYQGILFRYSRHAPGQDSC